VQSDASVIIVSEMASEIDRIVGLEVGADDYLAKPVSPRELLARVRAVRRRAPRHDGHADMSESCFTFAGCRIDTERRVLRDPRGLKVNLSDGEFSLLQIFVERPQRVLTRDQLLDLARGPDSEAYDRSIDTQISRLRRKLREISRDDLIRTIRNEGYMFVPKVDTTGNRPA
jgi:two-component system OmpR family response regulator